MSAFMVSDKTINTISFYTGISANKLVRMNADAIMARYGVDEMRRVKETEVGGLCEFVKALDCYLYQCSEGDVPECELYKHLDALAEKCEVLRGTRAYDAADWG